MFRIGDFSKLTQVTVKALRYYDELGLFAPAQVDPETGYRGYSAAQVPRLNRLLALKGLGFTLEEIAPMLDEGLPPSELRGMFRMKQAELRRAVSESEARLSQVEALLHRIEQEDKMPEYEVLVKRLEPQLVAGVADISPNIAALKEVFPRLFMEVYDQVMKNGGKPAGPAFDRYLDMEFCETDIKVEACAPIASPVPETDRVKVYTVEGAEQAACTIHQGSFDGLGGAFEAVMKWIEANGYRINGPGREVYLEFDPQGDPAKYVTEVQCPVTKN